MIKYSHGLLSVITPGSHEVFFNALHSYRAWSFLRTWKFLSFLRSWKFLSFLRTWKFLSFLRTWKFLSFLRYFTFEQKFMFAWKSSCVFPQTHFLILCNEAGQLFLVRPTSGTPISLQEAPALPTVDTSRASQMHLAKNLLCFIWWWGLPL